MTNPSWPKTVSFSFYATSTWLKTLHERNTEGRVKETNWHVSLRVFAGLVLTLYHQRSAEKISLHIQVVLRRNHQP